MIDVIPSSNVTVSDLTPSVRVTPTVLLMNFISAAAILLLSDFFSAQISHPYVIVGTESVLYTFSECNSHLLFVTPAGSVGQSSDSEELRGFTTYS